jgi:hypothetical protein
MQRSLPIYASTATRRRRRGWGRRRRGWLGLGRLAFAVLAALPVLGVAAGRLLG